MNIEFERVLNLKLSGYERGWTIHRVIAKVNDEKAGHITVSYITETSFNDIVKSNIGFMRKFKGWCCGQQGDSHPETLKQASWYLFHDNKLYEEIPFMSKESLDDLYQKIEDKIFELHADKIFKFKNRFINRGFVDYIEVFSSLRRNGIGSQLYIEAAKLLREYDMKLYTHGSPRPEAQECWNNFTKKGMTKIDKANGCMYLSL